MKSRDRKWKLALWTSWLCAGAPILPRALFMVMHRMGWIGEVEGATAMIVQGLSGIGGVLTVYGAVNVAQKGVIGAHYRAELDDSN